MGIWADGLWADGFWADNFWAGQTAGGTAIDQIAISIPKSVYRENSSFSATAKFIIRSTATMAAPTTVEYKIYNISSNEVIRDWTTIASAASVTIDITSADNAIRDDRNEYERMALLVAADRGLTTEANELADYWLTNVEGVSG